MGSLPLEAPQLGKMLRLFAEGMQRSMRTHNTQTTGVLWDCTGVNVLLSSVAGAILTVQIDEDWLGREKTRGLQGNVEVGVKSSHGKLSILGPIHQPQPRTWSGSASRCV